MDGMDSIKIRDYKGYEIHKVWRLDFEGKRIAKTLVYLVADDEDYIGVEYKTIEDAKAFIETLQ